MLLPCLFCLITTAVCMKHYSGQKLIRIELKEKEDFHKAIELQRQLENLEIDIWKEVSSESHRGFLDFLLPAEMAPLLDDLTLTYRVLIPDIQDLIEKTKITRVKREADVTSFHDKYHNLTEIQEWMRSLAVDYDKLVEVFPITESFEGRMLEGIKISTGPQRNKPAVWLQAGQHAREWIAPATLMYLVHKLLQLYDQDPNITALLDSVDVYAVPVVSVDGYEYTFTQDRLWRKTRSLHPGAECVGVDPNRNWDYQWEVYATRANRSCDSTYQGPAPFSEKVVQGVADYMQNHTRNIIAFLDFHSYGQMWLSPWGFSREETVDKDNQLSATQAAVDAIKSVHGRVYQNGQIARTFYSFGGGATDWGYGVLNITYSVGAELRDTGWHGFLLSPEEIIPSGEETLQGVLAYIQYINSQHDFISTASTISPTNEGSISMGFCLICYLFLVFAVFC